MRRLHALHIACTLILALGLSALAVGACGDGIRYSCANPDFTHHDKDGVRDECHCDDDPTGATVGGRDPDACDYCNGEGLDASTGASCVDAGADGPIESGERCAGRCWLGPPVGWSSPVLLAVGPPGDVPACPDAAPSVAYEGLAGLDAPPASCGACACDPPSGHCSLPTEIRAENVACSGTPSILIPFDPPAGWDGACTSGGAVAAGAMWNGAPAVQSVTIGPLALSEARCTPRASAAATIPPVSWASSARACAVTSGLCTTPGEICGPPAVAGFPICVFQPGEVACPTFGPYVERHVFYQGATDTRACSPCACDGPFGSACAATISVHADPSCGDPVLTAPLDAAAPRCVEVAAGTALGSKAATPPVYVPGACPASGGEATGAVVPRSPATFCCLPAS